VLPAGKVSSLVDAEGRFYRRGPFIERLAALNLEEVAAEWHAQVELFMKTTGRSPDHLDSHHHCSYFTPALFERMLFLAEELCCPIRNPYADVTCPPGDYLPGGQPEADLQAAAALLIRFAPRAPQHFFSNFYDEGASLESLGTLLHQVTLFPADQTCELMCHPAVVDAELREVSDYHDMRAHELTVLTNPKLPLLLQGMQIELVTFTTMSP
jgi:chitin disaccharide deacetylase